MNIVSYCSDSEEVVLCNAVLLGAGLHGHVGDVRKIDDYEEPTTDADMVIFVGAKSLGCPPRRDYARLRIKTMFLDKGVFAPSKFWRVSLDRFVPSHYIWKMEHSEDRYKRLGLVETPFHRSGEIVVVVTVGEAYCRAKGLGTSVEFMDDLVARLEVVCIGRKVEVWDNISRKSFKDEFENVWCLVTHSSPLAVMGLLYGVPVCTIGENVAEKIAVTEPEDVINPYYPTDEERLRLFSNLAYCQWTLSEFRSGEAWQTVEDHMQLLSRSRLGSVLGSQLPRPEERGLKEADANWDQRD